MRRTLWCVALLAGLACAGEASAQGFGIGPRFSFVRGNVVTGEPSTRFFGGTMRMGGSKHAALELSLDYRSTKNLENTLRIRETPIQGSLLIFPVRSVFAPYLLGGGGIYGRTFDELDAQGQVIATTTDRKFGIHLGGGAEFFLIRHAAIFVDYRYRFVRFGTPGEDDQPINIPGSKILPGLDKLKVSHQGSMWTTGVAFYF